MATRLEGLVSRSCGWVGVSLGGVSTAIRSLLHQHRERGTHYMYTAHIYTHPTCEDWGSASLHPPGGLLVTCVYC